MNILFLYPHPAEDRCRQYRSAALTLQNDFGHKVVFVYVGMHRAFDDNIPTEHFESWVQMNQGLIDRTSLIELEREFNKSNLWRGIVAQRTFTDYSYIGNSFPRRKASLPELETYLKAVVLFYRDLCKRYEIDVAIAQAPDGIHSQMLFELALSGNFVAINQFYDPYWRRNTRYMMDEVCFSSSLLRKRYKQNVMEYGTLVLPHEKELEKYLVQIKNNDPRATAELQIFPVTLRGTIDSALRGMFNESVHFSLFHVDIFHSYFRPSFWQSVCSFGARVRNLMGRRLLMKFSHELPTKPYVFFALQYQPESATLASAPVWSDMLAITRILSAALPSGFQLVVKDHPFIGGYRSTGFYRLIQELPNVVLLPENFPTSTIVNGSSLVTTVSGTVGLQALVSGKRLLLFGHVYYDCIEGILRPPPDLNDLPIMLKNILVNEISPFDEALRRRSMFAFLSAYESVMRHNPKMEYPRSEEEKGEGLAELIDQWIRIDLMDATENLSHAEQ